MLVGTVEATFLILLLIIVFGPVIAERVRVPGIIGLIFGGMIFGPFVIDWLSAGGLVTDLGAIGILYLMFLVGVSFDVQSFQENKRGAITYGLLGFAIPFVLTIAVALALFDTGFLAASMLGAMWASNTLIAYPEVQAAGLQKNRAVSAAVSAGVVADLLSLTVLAFATASAVIELDPFPGPFSGTMIDLVEAGPIEPTTPNPTLPLWLALPLLGFFCLWFLPKVTSVFFVRVGRSRMQRFVFALAGMAAGATVALMGGIEGLIGAFLAGLGMNRLIPSRGLLMNRLEFVGAAIFVPAFLVAIGLNIDPALLLDPETLLLGLLFTAFVLIGKSAAAVITGLVFKFSVAEVGLMSSLSFGQAASTLAIAQVGLQLGMFEQIVVNASVIAIILTALITSYGSRYFSKHVPKPVLDQLPIGESVLLDVRPHGSDLKSLVGLAAAIAEADDGLVTPYQVTDPGSLAISREVVDAAARAVAAQGLDSDGIVRVDESFADGTVHLVEEHDVSLVVLSWAGPKFSSDYLFGNDIDSIGEASPVPTMATRIVRPWKRVVVVLGDIGTHWRRDDSALALSVARRLHNSDHSPMLVHAPDQEGLSDLLGELDDVKVSAGDSVADLLVDGLSHDDLLIVPAFVLHDIPVRAGWKLSKTLDNANIGVIAGPYRLSVSKGITKQSLASTIPT